MGEKENIIAFLIALKQKIFSFSESQSDGEHLNAFLVDDITVKINHN